MQRATVSFHRFHWGTIFGLASDGVYRACCVTTAAVSSYLAFPPLPYEYGGLFLLHWPGSRLHRTLSGILPCEARTFLTCKKCSRDHLSNSYNLIAEHLKKVKPQMCHTSKYREQYIIDAAWQRRNNVVFNTT